MPYKDKISGIYKISTPNGNSYIGSSINIYRRWVEHKGLLRRKKHHSIRLQAAHNKHGNNLVYEILCICSRDDLNLYEQLLIDFLDASLNTTQFVNNVWTNPLTREKLERCHKSEKWSKERSEISSRPNKNWVKIESSIGEVFISLSEAARKYKTTSSHIKILAESQTLGVIGIRFKHIDANWTEEKTRYEKTAETRRGLKVSKKGIDNMKKAAKGRIPCKLARKKSKEAISVAVVGTSIDGKDVIMFDSIREAGRFVMPMNKQAGSSISRVLSGKRKHAYGYSWKRNIKRAKSNHA